MKKLLLFALGAVVSGNMMAQNCVPDILDTAMTLGFVPNPIVGSTEGVAYDEVVTIVLPGKVDNTLSPAPGDSLSLCAIGIVSVTGLPSGYSYDVWAKTGGTGAARQVIDGNGGTPDTIGINQNSGLTRACLRLSNLTPPGPTIDPLVDSVPITVIVEAYLNLGACTGLGTTGRDTFVVKLPVKDAVFASIDDEMDPNTFGVYNNYPNPAQGFTNIHFSTPSAGQVEITVFDAVGRQVKSVSFTSKPGVNTYVLETSSLRSGIYMYNVKYNNKVQSKKLIISK